MNLERLTKTVMFELTADLAKLEDDLERNINSDLPLSDKTHKIKILLSQITMIEASMTKFSSMLTKPSPDKKTNNDNNQN